MLLLFVVAIGVLVAAATTSAAHVRPWRRLERGCIWLAVALAAIATTVLLVVPIYTTFAASSSVGVQGTQRGTATLVGVIGLWALPLVLLPVVLTLVPLLRGTPHQRRVRSAIAALVLVGFTILGGFSIGLLYVPSALAILAAATTGVVIERTA